MTDRYISVNHLKETLSKLNCETGNSVCRHAVNSTLHELMPQVIDDEPMSDVQPVKRGHWIEKSEEYYKLWQESGRSYNDMPYFITGLHFACGVCFDKYEVNAEGVEFWDFCPHCGADMREKEGE